MRYAFWGLALSRSSLAPPTQWEVFPRPMSYSRQGIYPWLVSLSCLIVTVVNGGIFFTFTIFIGPLEGHFGWSRAEVSLVWTLMLLAYVPGSILLGRVSDRQGPRWAIAVAAVTIGLGLVMASRVGNLPSLLAAYSIIGFGAGATFTVPAATIQRWFDKRRGLMMGIVVAGSGAGGLFAPITQRFIASYGWSHAFVLLGGLFGVLLALAAMGMLKHPERMGLRPYGWAGETASLPAGHGSGYAMGEALRLPAFWGLLAIVVLVMSPNLFVTAHLAPLATGRGISASQAAWVVMLMAIFTAVGQIFLGGAAERIGWMRGAATAAFISGASVLGLLAAGNAAMVYAFAIVFGTFLGGAIVLLMGAASVFFGTRALAEVLGYFIGTEVLVGALFSLIGGVMFDRMQTYLVPLGITATALTLAGIYALVIKPPTAKGV